MSTLPLGPYRVIPLASGMEMPWYMLPFDREGYCEGPETRKHLMSAIKAQNYTDIYLFSHGWNNNWKDATDRYRSFIEGYAQLRNDRGWPLPDGFRPLLVGVFWPSIALVTESERAPRVLADGGPDEDSIVEERARIAELAAAVDGSRRDRFYELVQRDTLDKDGALELAKLLQPLYANADDELDVDGAITPEDIVAGWAAESSVKPATKETSGSVDRRRRAGPKAAGWRDALMKLLPRDAIRMATVYQMKDRAGKIGALGVRKLLEDLLGASAARLHLIGHSYGAKVLLSALTTATLPADRKAYSMLLLQPAVSHLCFAEKLPDSAAPGGYHGALDRVERPIFATYSSRDFALRRVFHTAVRRSADKGEARIAPYTGAPPSIYAALGGYGPRNSGESLIDIVPPLTPFDLSKGARLYGIDGSTGISDHGDISNPYTWWASHCASWQG
jgi:hypothetical protein